MKTKTLVMLAACVIGLMVARAATALPVAQILPDPLEFPATRAGTDSASDSFTLTNVGTGSVPLCVFSVKIGDPAAFIIDANDCLYDCLAVGESCGISLHFHPGQVGHYASTMTLIDLSSSVIDSAGITGQGIAPAVMLYPASLAFGDSEVGGSVEYRQVLLTNSGSDALAIASIATDAPFSVTSNCGATLDPQASCILTVGFQPTEVGVVSGSVAIADDAADSPQAVPLTGTGIPPGSIDIGLSTTAVDFGGQQVGTTSEAETITVTNVGTSGTPLKITSIVTIGNFSENDTCLNADLAPGATCTIFATFTPTVAGQQNGAITLTDNATDSPQTIDLTGVGTEPETPQASLSASSLDFGNIAVNGTSAAQTLTITNTGGSDLVVQLTSIDGDSAASYSRVDGCHQQTITPGGTCTISVTFHPAAAGVLGATLSIADDAADSPQAVALTGTGVASAGGGGCSLTRGAGLPAGALSVLIAGAVLWLARRRWNCHRG